MDAASTGEFPCMKGNVNSNMNCDILKQSMIPSLRKLGGFPTRLTPNTQEAEGKGVGQAKMSPDLNLLEYLRSILK